MTRLAWLIATLVLVCAHAVAAETAVTLRRTAVVAADQPLLLGDVAEVTGADAERLRELEVAKAGVRQVDLDMVRQALAAQGVNAARVTLSGHACRLEQPGMDRTQGAGGPRAPRNAAPADVSPEPLDLNAPATHRTAIGMRLADLFGVPPDDLRLGFASLTTEQRELLARPLDPAQRLRVQPHASVSGRLPLEVDLYQGDRLVARHRLSAQVQVRRAGVVASRTVDRGQALTVADLTEDERWLSPSVDAPLPRAQVEGLVARRRIEAGAPITAQDVQSPMVIRRGDLVIVHALSGSVAVKAKARALENAREGEAVKLQVDGGKRAFTARATGRGEAVLELAGETQEEGMP